VNNRLTISILSLATVLLLAACGSINYNSRNSPKIVVSADHTPFYHNGPLQGNGPDLFLDKGDEVEVLRKEIGCSFVRIYDGQSGYVSNEALTPARPAEPSPSPKAPLATPSPTPKPVAARTTGTPSPQSTNALAIPGFRY